MAGRSLSVTWLALPALFAYTPLASAASWPISLTLDATSCDSTWLNDDDLTRAIRSELEADGVTVLPRDSARPSEGALSVSVACDADRVARVGLRARTGERQVEQSVALADADPSARARVLALAISELVRSTWPDLSHPSGPVQGAAFPDVAPPGPAPAPPVAPPPPAPLTAPAPAASPAHESAPERRPHSSVAVALALQTRWFVDYSSVSFGGNLGADLGSFRVRAEGLFGSQQDTSGSAAIGSAALTLGYRVLDTRVGAISIAGYPVVAAGVTWLRGEANASNVRVAPITGFYGDLRFLLEAKLVAPKLTPSIALELGRATGFVARADDRDVGASGGFFLGASIGGRY